MKRILKLAIVPAIIVGHVFSASDGSGGKTSEGQVNLNLTKGNEVRVSSLSDVNFGAVNQAPGMRFIDFCVYSTTGSYDVTPSSANPSGNDFRLANSGATSFISYDLEFNNAPSGTSGRDLNNNTTSVPFNNAHTTSSNCNGANNARLFFDISSSSFNRAPADSYSDILTIVISPR